MQQHLLTGCTIGCQGLVNLRDALGERARFVGAQHIHAAEVLDGGEPFHNHLLAGHAAGAMGQVHADDRRQQLRRQAHPQRQGEQKGVDNRAVEVDVDREDQRDQEQRDLQQQVAEAAHSSLELGFRPALAQLGGDGPVDGAAAGVDHHSPAGAAHHMAAHRQPVAALSDGRFGCQRFGRRWHHALAHRKALAGERGFIHGEIPFLQQPAVRRDARARRQHHHIAGHHVGHRHLQLLTAAHHRAAQFHHRQQLVDGPCGTALLPEAQQAAQQHDQQDDRAICERLQRERQQRRPQQDQDDRAEELPQQQVQIPRARPCREPIRAQTLQPRERLSWAQPLAGAAEGVEQLRQRCAPEGMIAALRVSHLCPGCLGPS